ncbi:MAG: hypothetical protein U1F43_18235 [Myxococcota bacterium]
MNALVVANQAAHARFLAALEEALVALTTLDLARATDAWSRLGAALARHERVEAELLALQLDVVAPRGGGAALVVAEHRRLDLLHAEATATIAGLEAVPDDARRLAMVRGLDELLRVRHLLEHHGQREDDIVYPFLGRALDGVVVAGFAQRLGAT